MFIQFRKVWKCQADNKNQSTELGQGVQWSKEDKETKTVHRIPRIWLNIEYEPSWSGKVSVFCSTSGNHHRFTCFLYPFTCILYIYCYYDFRIKKCSVRLFLQLFVGGSIFYLHNLCRVMCFLFCLSSSCVLSTQCCQFLWIVYSFTCPFGVL